MASLVVLRSTVYPGTTEYVATAFADRGKRVDVAFCPERIAEGHALEELHTLPADHRRGHRGRRRPRRGAVRTARGQDAAHHEQGGGARQAVHQHVALHEVRRREPVLRDRRPGRRRLHERAARRPRGLPARRGPAGPRLRRRSVPVQGHDAAGRVHVRPLPARPGRDADQRGHAGVHRVGARAAPRQPARPHDRHPRAWRSRPSPTTSARR